MRSFTLLILVSVCLAGPVVAKMYKWVDENGVTHFSNTAPPQDTEVQATEEAVGRAVDTSPQDLDQVLRSYKKDEIGDKYDKVRNQLEQKRSKINKSAAKKYARMVENYQRDVDYWKQRLDEAERESYSDKSEHLKKIRHCKKMLADYQSLLQQAKSNHQEYAYGN